MSANNSLFDLLRKMFRWDILVGIFGIIGAIYTVRSFYKSDEILNEYDSSANTFAIDSTAESEEITNEVYVNKIDSTKYYWEKIDSRGLFIKGLKNALLFDTTPGSPDNGNTYIYKCGRVISVTIVYIQTGFCFITKDEAEEQDFLDYDFGKIGYEPFDENDDLAFKEEYITNQYIIGQYDIDGDEIDELIISVRTTDEDIFYGETWETAGISINVFKLIGGAWKRVGVLNTSSNVHPVSAKFINNNVYIYWLRNDEKFVFNGKGFEEELFEGRVFKKSDFSAEELENP